MMVFSSQNEVKHHDEQDVRLQPGQWPHVLSHGLTVWSHVLSHGLTVWSHVLSHGLTVAPCPITWTGRGPTSYHTD